MTTPDELRAGTEKESRKAWMYNRDASPFAEDVQNPWMRSTGRWQSAAGFACLPMGSDPESKSGNDGKRGQTSKSHGRKAALAPRLMRDSQRCS